MTPEEQKAYNQGVRDALHKISDYIEGICASNIEFERFINSLEESI